MIWRRVQKAAITLVLAALIGLSLGASSDMPGAKVEVREGDLWSQVTVLRKEGRKTLIRYDDNTEEWVTADRLREVSGTPRSASTTRPAVPHAMRLDLDSAAAPRPGKMTPLNLATTRPTKAFRSATIPGRDGMYFPHAQSVALCRDTPGIVVFGFVSGVGLGPIEVICFDSNTGQMIGRYPLSMKGQRIVGAANSGKVILTTERIHPQHLYLWELQGQTYTMTAQYELDPSVKWIQFACLTDATHAVLRDYEDNCFYIDLRKNCAIGRIHASRATRTYVDPTGQVLAVIAAEGRAVTGGKAVLIRLSDFSTIAEFPGAAHKGNVAIDPAGEQIAFFSDDGPVRVVRLSDGSVVGNIQVAWQHPGELDLPGEGFLLVDHRCVYDILTGIPVWAYNRPPTAVAWTWRGLPQYEEPWFTGDRASWDQLTLMIQLANGQTLFCSQGKDSSDIIMATLPDDRARNALKGVGKKTFMLTPGTPVSFSSSGAGSDADSSRIADVVRNAIKAAGLVLSRQREDFHVTLSIGPESTQQHEYFRWTQAPYGPVSRSPLPLWGQGGELAREGHLGQPNSGTPGNVDPNGILGANRSSGSIPAAVADRLLGQPSSGTAGDAESDGTLGADRPSDPIPAAVEGHLPGNPQAQDGGGQVALAAPSTVVTVEMTYKNQPVWSQQITLRTMEGTSIKPGQTAQAATTQAAWPSLSNLRFLVIPAYLPTGYTPGSTPALGASDVTPRGLFPSADPPL